MKAKPAKAYAVVDIKKPVISVMEIYETKDIKIEKGEKIIRVKIEEIR